MKIHIATERLILRKLEYTDENDLFEMDSDPEVHLYIENNPVKSIDEITKAIFIANDENLGADEILDSQYLDEVIESNR